MDLTISDAKKDAVTLRLERGARWTRDHWQQILLALGALAVAAVLGAYVVHNLRKVRALAWEQLTVAQSQAGQGNRAEAMQTLERLLAATRSAPLLTQAYLFKGDTLILENRNDEARDAYENALRQAPSPALRALAVAGRALAWEQSRTWPEAESAYRQFLQEFPEHFLAPRVHESLGRVLMVQQKWGDAQTAFERLVTLYPATAWAKNAQEYLNVVKAQAPQASAAAPPAP